MVSAMVEVMIFALFYLGVVKKEERAKDIWTVEKKGLLSDIEK